MILRLLKWTFILVFCLTLAFYITFSPIYLKEVTFHGRTIKIDRDNYGIPTIHASSMQEYLYGLGTAIAEDRLFQMTFRAYAAQGRLSQFLGEKSLQFDRLMREVNLRKWANLRAERLKNQNISEYLNFEAMAHGVNDRVAQMLTYPLEFHLTGAKWENFTVNHLFYFAIQFEWAISMNTIDEYTRSALLANHTKEQIQWILPNKKETWAFQSIPIVADDEIPQRLRTDVVKDKLEQIRFNPLSVERVVKLDIIEYISHIDATNCWVVSGEHTESGLPLLSNDPHLESIAPSQWYPFNLNFTFPDGTSMLAVGGSNPGSTHLYGKTPYLAVGFSISYGDNQDLYRQKIEGNQYLLDGKWHDLTIRNETILVKTSEGIRNDIYEVKETHRGPIIHYLFNSLGSYSLENDTLSLAWTGYNSEWASVVNITYNIFPRNFDEVRNMLQNGTKTFINCNINVITADNHIVMQQSGLHPIRRNVESGTYIKDGTTSLHDWVGLVPPEDRMHVYDPPKGYMIHANNKVAEHGYYGGYLDHTIYTARADRIDELIRAQIKAGRKINDQFAKKVFMDTVDVYCRQILPEITEVAHQSRELLSNFDCNFTSQSHQATLYQVFMYQLYQLMKPFSSQKMCLISFHQMQQGIYNYIHFAFRGDMEKRKVMIQAWNNTISHLSSHFKNDDPKKWIWGEFHNDHTRHVPFRAHFLLKHIYDLNFPGSGNMHTPNMAKMEQLQFGNFETTNRANSRTLFGYGKGHKDEVLIDTGVSQNILSSHYSDQWKLFKRGEMIDLFEKVGTDLEL